MHFLRIALIALLYAVSVPFAYGADGAVADPVVMVVMDPLAKPLSCPCVAGYAQRDYDKLASALEKSLQREVRVVFDESLAAAVKKHDLKQVHLVIGKQSVVAYDAKSAKVHLRKVAMLTGKDGLTTQRGLVVVPVGDSAKQISDLKGVQIYFGPQESDEKHAAALQLFARHGVETPAKLETVVACDEGAVKILEMADKGSRGCAVISSYAKPLLEGCGQVPKGALRVVGETEGVPFIAAFVNEGLEDEERALLSRALLKSTESNIALRIALETNRGFVVEDPSENEVAKKK
jgi:ABC-type phosphate/phosphonate transport system substrate-binding protein